MFKLVRAMCAADFPHLRFSRDALALISDAVAGRARAIAQRCARTHAVCADDVRFVLRSDAKASALFAAFAAVADGTASGAYAANFYKKGVAEKSGAGDVVDEFAAFVAYADAHDIVRSIAETGAKAACPGLFSRRNVVDFCDVKKALLRCAEINDF